MDRDGRYRVRFLDPLDVPREAAGTPEVSAWWVQLNLNAIEDWVRRYPDNSGDYFFWTDPPAPHSVPAAA
jgi:hypothetical protein